MFHSLMFCCGIAELGFGGVSQLGILLHVGELNLGSASQLEFLLHDHRVKFRRCSTVGYHVSGSPSWV